MRTTTCGHFPYKAKGLCNTCYQRQWRNNNKESVSKIARKSIRRLKLDMIEAYGNVCECCGENIPEFLALDHINGGGTKERNRISNSSGSGFYRKMKKRGWPKNGYRLLCHNCNLSLGFFGYCPHKNPEKKIIKQVA